MADQTRPDVYSYLSYRQFLRDFVAYLRSQKLYSVRDFAKTVGFKSSSFMKMIIEGSRRLNPKTASAVAKGFNLKDDERNFLVMLVQMESAETNADHQKWLSQILAEQSKRKRQQISGSQLRLLSQWYLLVILEALDTKAKGWDHKLWARSLNLSRERIEESFNLLLDLDLIERNGESWKRLDSGLETSPLVKGFPVRLFHQQMIEKALRAANELGNDRIDLGAMTVGLTRQDFEKLRQKLFDFRNELASEYAAGEKSEAVYQLNMQFFEILALDQSSS